MGTQTPPQSPQPFLSLHNRHPASSLSARDCRLCPKDRPVSNPLPHSWVPALSSIELAIPGETLSPTETNTTASRYAYGDLSSPLIFRLHFALFCEVLRYAPLMTRVLQVLLARSHSLTGEAHWMRTFLLPE